MKKPFLAGLALFFLSTGPAAFAQPQTSAADPETATSLFTTEEPLNIHLQYSNRELRKNTNDSTYLECMLSYQDADGQWDSLEVRVRARGNWRKENCFLAPVKLKIKKKEAEGTLFEGSKELKLVLPCRDNEYGQDYVIKEYLAYKLYEKVSPYHFKTRRLSVAYTDDSGKKAKDYVLEGFLIEDVDQMAERCNAKKLTRSVHPLQQDDLCSVQNDFFQYMIGNTDFSVAYQHNEKLIFVEGRSAIPVPYDFDMCGLVNANYAVVSQVQGESLEISHVTQRLYRGFKRSPAIYEQVRQEFLSKKDVFMEQVDALQPSFRKSGQFEGARDFVLEFFEVLQNDNQYRQKILAMAREK
ncbi:hypothetical protein [Robiginitalea marina]|uniref:Uncharacterized protein n=1 Tax=Robiginitalea marina TaxID=2954105 RepID=A0ABT1B175_9FLAO|nr:hypothetical protein [Robiginitalea marina]